MPPPSPTFRRKFLTALITGLGGMSLASRTQAQGSTVLARTPGQFEGPYYPVVPIPHQPHLLAPNAGPGAGEVMWLSGRVLDTMGRPVPQVVIELWQADHAGLYRHPKAPQTQDVHPAFAGFAAQTTDAQGQYRFRTIVPVPYTGRVPHIHAKLKRDGQEILVTQIYLAGQEQEGGVLMSLLAALYGDRSALRITPARGADGQMQAQFDFVV